MATLLDIGLFEKFGSIFPFLFVLVVIYGTLNHVKFLGENKFIHSAIALIFAILVLASDSISAIINEMAPWFVLVFMFIIFLVMLFKTMGEQKEFIPKEVEWIKMTFLIVFFVIFIFSVIDATVWDKDTRQYEDVVTGGEVGGGNKEAFFATLRHPKVLGLILILLISSFTIQNLTKA